MGGQASEQASGCGPGRHRQLGRQISSEAHHGGNGRVESASATGVSLAGDHPDQPPQDSQWQVSDRRYLSEGSMALLTATTKEVAPTQLLPA